MQLLSSRWGPRLGAVAVLLLAFTATGCSKSGKVRGTVTFDGRPLPAGQITFKGPNDTKTVEIVDGKFTIDAPVGACKIGIQTDYLLGSGAAVPGAGGAIGGPNFEQLPPEERREKERKMKEEGSDVMDKSKEEEAKRKKDAANYVEIPESYNDPDKSGLTVTVTKGVQDAPAFELRSPPGWQPTKKALATGGGMPPGGVGPGGGMPPGGMPPGGFPPGGMPPGGKPPGAP